MSGTHVRHAVFKLRYLKKVNSLRGPAIQRLRQRALQCYLYSLLLIKCEETFARSGMSWLPTSM